MYLLRITGFIFVLGLWISKLVAAPVTAQQSHWDAIDSKTYSVKPFSKLYLEGTFKVVLAQGSQPGLVIKTDEENFGDVQVESDAASSVLKVVKKRFDLESLTIYITFKDLTELHVQGGISFETKGYVDLKELNLVVQGGVDGELMVKADKLSVVGEGGMKLKLEGVASELKAKVSGAAYLNALNLQTKRTDIHIEGVGAASVFATENLHATIAGIGKIRYRGDPAVFKNIEGIGTVSKD